MVFSLAGFIGGASEKLTQVIEEKEEEILEANLLKEEREWQDSQYKQRLSLQRDETIAAETRARNQQIEDLTSTVAFMYDKDTAAYFAKQGIGALNEAVTFGTLAQNAGRNAMDYMKVHNNNIDESKKTLQNITGSETEAAIPTISFERTKLQREIQRQGAVGDLEQMLAVNTDEMNLAIDNNNKDAVSKALKKQKRILEAMSLEDPETIDQIFTNPLTLFNNMRAQYIGGLGGESGDLGQAMSELEGVPQYNDLMDLGASERVLTATSGYNANQVSNTVGMATQIKEQATTNLLNYANSVYENFSLTPEYQTILDRNKEAEGGATGMDNAYFFMVDPQPPTQEFLGKVLDASVDEPNLGSIIILRSKKDNSTKVAVYTGIPNRKLGGAPYVISDY